MCAMKQTTSLVGVGFILTYRTWIRDAMGIEFTSSARHIENGSCCFRSQTRCDVTIDVAVFIEKRWVFDAVYMTWPQSLLRLVIEQDGL